MAESVAEVESRFLREAEPLGLNVVRLAAWHPSSKTKEGDEFEPEQTLGHAGAIAYVDTDLDQFVAIIRRQYFNADGGADVTAAMIFSIPDDLPLGQKRFKALRRRLALGPAANIAGPLMSGVAANAIAGLTSVPVAPPWPDDMNYVDFTDLSDDDDEAQLEIES